MKVRLQIVAVTAVLLLAVALPIWAPAPIINGSRGASLRMGYELAARPGTLAECQSGTACGG
jgi:hypothetical protein